MIRQFKVNGKNNKPFLGSPIAYNESELPDLFRMSWAYYLVGAKSADI
jgi:hypothetical protein